jgi:hypothetical protein
MSEKPQRWAFSLSAIRSPELSRVELRPRPHLIQTSFRRRFARQGDDRQADGECDRESASAHGPADHVGIGGARAPIPALRQMEAAQGGFIISTY